MVENKETNLMTKMFLETLSPFDFGSTVELLSKEIENKSVDFFKKAEAAASDPSAV